MYKIHKHMKINPYIIDEGEQTLCFHNNIKMAM